MKKTLKKWFVTLLSAMMVFSALTITAAAEEEEYQLYIGFGGDAAESGDWGYGYNSPNAEDNKGGIEAVTETIKVGETKTVSLTLPSEAVYTWWLAPVLVAEGVTDLSVDVQVSIDGNDVTGDVDFAAGDAWWYEGTGEFNETQAIRLAGGYNEWGTHYMESPVFTTIEYTITLNSLTVGGGEEAAGEPVELTGPFDLFVGFGGDATESGDWGFQFNSPNAENNAGEIVAVTESISVGETKTVSLTLPSEAVYTWWLAPVIVAEGVTDLSADVQVSIDGNDVTGDVDFAAGDAWWYEGTGEFDETQAIRLAGGYNEWGTHYMESPVFTTIEYTVTLNKVMAGGAAAPEEGAGEEETPEAAVGAVDLDGTYHAYLGFQTPKFSFRNAFDDATYGRDVEGGWFNQVTGWNGNDPVVIPGTFTDAEIAGNGTYTVSVDGLEFPDGEFADQEFMNLIFLSTDIPNTGEITISDIKLTINGSSVDLGAGPIVSPDSVNYLNMLLQNIWNDEVKELGYYAVPPTSMSITFTVSGFNYDAEVQAEEPTEAPAEPADDNSGDTTPAEPASSDDTKEGGANVGLIVGIVAAVVVVAGGAGFVVAKKKKK